MLGAQNTRQTQLITKNVMTYHLDKKTGSYQTGQKSKF